MVILPDGSFILRENENLPKALVGKYIQEHNNPRHWIKPFVPCVHRFTKMRGCGPCGKKVQSPWCKLLDIGVSPSICFDCDQDKVNEPAEPTSENKEATRIGD
jgi:hypothetical protein